MGLFDQVANAASGNGGGGGSSSGGDQGRSYYDGGGGSQGQGGGGYQYPTRFDWNNFDAIRQQVNQAAMSQQPTPWAQQQFGDWQQQQQSAFQQDRNQDSTFSMNGGTERLFNNKYREANPLEYAAIKAGEAGEFFNTLPAQIAGAVGGEQAKQDWTFNPQNFNLSNGIDATDAAEVGKFAASLPGMLVGGVLEGASKATEALTGAPIQEHREQDGKYEIADYTLDASQRAAAGVDAAIDIAGIVTGGGAKLASVPLKAAGKGMIKAFAKGSEEQIAKSVARYEKAKAFNDTVQEFGTGFIRRAGGGPVAEFGKDVAEEAGEEFVQSYADDIRHKNLDEGSFDRALTGAAWGAAGGGLMHGMGVGLNRVINGKSNGAADSGNQTQDPSVAPQSMQDNSFERDRARNETQQTGRFTSSAAQRLVELQRDPKTIEASTSQYNTVVNDSLDLTESMVGERAIHAMLQADDGGKSIARLANKFGTTAEELARIDSMDSETDRVAGYNQLIANQGGRVTFVAGRNPDTNEVGTADVDLVAVMPGEGVAMNRDAFMMFGADVDGDKSQIYFGPGAQSLGYLTKSLINPATGISNVNGDYLSYKDTPRHAGVLFNSMKKYLDDTGLKLSDQTIGKLTADYRAAATKGDAQAVMQVFDELRGRLLRAAGNMENAEYLADKGVAYTMRQMHVAATTLGQKFDDVVKKFNDDEQKARDALSKLVPEDDRFLRSGDSKGATHFADFAAMFGYKIYFNTGISIGNPILRQSGQVYYHSKEDQKLWFGELSPDQVKDVYAQMIAFSFSLGEIGGDVENSIEGLFRISVQDRVRSALSARGSLKIDINGGWDAFANTFIEVYNDYASQFNSVLKDSNTQFDDSFIKKATKQPISKGSKAELARAFVDIFGTWHIDEVLNLSEKHPMKGKTFEQACSEFALAPGRDMGPFSNYRDFNSFWKTLLEDYGGKQRALGSRIDDAIVDCAKKARDMRLQDILEQTTDAEGNIIYGIKEGYMNELAEFIDATNLILGVDESIRLSLATVESFINTEYGRRWISGDENEMRNVYLSVRLSSQFTHAIDAYTSGLPSYKEDTKVELANVANAGPLQMWIYADAMDNDWNPERLRWLTDLDVPYGNKVTLWEALQGENFASGTLISECSKSENTMLGTSAITERLNKASRSLDRATKISNSINRATLERVNNLRIDDSVKIAAIKEFARNGYTDMSMDAMVAFVHSQRDIVKGMVDKGIAPPSSDVMFQMMQHASNGGLMSFLDGLNLELGSMSIGNFQANRMQILNILFDKEAEIRIYDPMEDGYVTLTRDRLFEEINGECINPDANWYEWSNLMDNCPALVSIISPSTIGIITEDGNSTVSEGVTKSLDKAIVEYDQDRTNVNGQLRNDKIRNEITQIAFRDPDWWGCFVASIDGIADSATPAQTAEIARQALRQHIDWFMTYASMDPNGEGYVTKSFYWNLGTFENALDSIVDFADDIDIADKLARTVGSVSEQATSKILRTAFDMQLKLGVSSYAESIGLELEEDQAEIAEYFSASTMNQVLEEGRDELKVITMTVLNMLDSKSLNLGQYFSSTDGMVAVNSMLSKAENDPNIDQSKVKKVKDKIKEWQDNGFTGLLDFLGYDTKLFDVPDAEWPAKFPRPITDESEDWSEDQWIAACRGIATKLNLDQDFTGKAEKEIRKAVKSQEWDKLMNIRRYYNQLIVTAASNDMMFGKGESYNPLAIKQEIEARRTMCKLGDEIRRQMGGHEKFEPSSRSLPEIKFHYKDPSVSYMSTSMVMNAQSGSIPSGISLDGATMKTVAAFGLLEDYECGIEPVAYDPADINWQEHQGWNFIDKDGKLKRISSIEVLNEIKQGIHGDSVSLYAPGRCLCGACRTCSPGSKSRGLKKVNFLARSISSLVNWMQEASHLKLKKSLGAAEMFANPLSTNKDLREPMSLNASAQDTRNALLEALYTRRTAIANYYMETDAWGSGGVDGFGIEHAVAFANATTPLMEILMNDGTSVTISTAFLGSEDEFQAHYGDLGLDVSNIESVRPVVMGLQEIAAKITRGITNQAYGPNMDIGNIPVSQIRKWAAEAMRDWDTYGSKSLSIRNVMNGVAARGRAASMPMRADMRYTPTMKWDDANLESMKKIFSPKRSKIESAKQMSRETFDSLRAANDNAAMILDRSKNSGANGFFNNHVIVKYSDDGGAIRNPLALAFERYNFSDTELGNLPDYPAPDHGRYSLAEMYDGSDPAKADRAYQHAAETGRSLVVRIDVIESMKSIGMFEKTDALSSYAFTSNGHRYTVIEPDYARYLQSFTKTKMEMATRDFDPNEINVAIASMKKLGLPDAGHYTRKGYKAQKMYHGRHEITSTMLLDGVNQITLVTDPQEIASIEMGDIDFSYYEGNMKNKSVEGEFANTYKDAAASFINKFKANQYSSMPESFRYVKQDECVGFVKTIVPGGITKYAPIYYEGSVAHVASYVAPKLLGNGKVVIDFAADQVDYSNNADMKLDLYGVAYKSVGREADDSIMEKWAALDDCGFNVATMADHMFDYHALSGRVFEMGDSILQNNLYFFTRKAGVNLFYTRNNDGTWTRRKDLIATPEFLADLVNGSYDAWADVASGERVLFGDPADPAHYDQINQIIQSLTAEIMLQGGFPHLFFNSARVTTNEEGNLEFQGLERRSIDPRIVTKYMSTDRTLAFYNFIDPRLCPPDLATDPDAPGSTPTVFDRQGRMLDMNTESGDPERCIALVGPNYYTGEGSAISDLSRSASWSQQHTLKRMLDIGVYPQAIRDTIDALATTVGRFDGIISQDPIEERVAERQKKYVNMRTEVDENLLTRVHMASRDPLYTSAVERYRNSIERMGDEFATPIFISENINGKESALDNKQMKRDIENLVSSLNAALGNPSALDALQLDEVIELVRFVIGYSNNDGTGITSITFNQFKNAIDEIKANLEESGKLIVGGRYKRGTRTETRIQIPLLPRGLNMRLMQMPAYQARYASLDELIEDQKEDLKVTVAEIKKIEDTAKRNALFKMCDAVCLMNGVDRISGHILDDVYMCDLVESVKMFGTKISGLGPEVLDQYYENVKLNDEYMAAIERSAEARSSSKMDTGNGDYRIVFHGDNRTIATYILRTLASARRCMGLTYATMFPANILERGVNQAEQSIAMRLGQAGIGPYQSNAKMNPDIRRNITKDENFRKLYIALRQAELVGADRELMNRIRNGRQLDQAIEETLRERGAFERFQEKFMNVMSGHDVFIEGQMRNFIDRMWQRSQTEAPWWHAKAPATTDAEGNTIEGRTLFEQRLAEDPSGWLLDVLNGRGEGKAADMILARQCMNWAKRGDMAQKNLVSAVYAELANRSATIDFLTTAFVSPYFQYATNRMGRILNWIAPISSIHYLATEFFSTGPGSSLKLGRTGVSFGDLGLQDVQMQASFREAAIVDMLHLGPLAVAMLLVGMSGALQPPEDDKKKGNFKEWTIFGLRVDANWWIEDCLGLALPMATFMATAAEGQPRIDLLANGLGYYLSNNPVVKVADAVSILFDPMAELYQEYDKDLEGYAKSMGGPPDIWQVLMGKSTSFGLSFVSQFITPGIVREIYNNSQQFEKSYKRVYQTDATGQLTEEGRDDNRTQYTSYEDAIIRKFTRNNPVMGFMADMIMHPETGYMAHEMPNTIIYDPMQMNSIEVFSMYEDPYTKQVEKSVSDKMAVAFQAIGVLQSKSVDELYQEGFMLDYDTKVFISQVIWDNIATLNNEWAELEQSGALNYYNVSPNDPYGEGARIVSEMKQSHYAQVQALKNLYNDKLWADKLKSPAQYNQRHTTYAQDVEGNWYATGYYPSWWTLVSIAPGETESGYKYVMSPQNDWATESIVTGDSTGIRALVRRTVEKVQTPDIMSWSSDGTDTGHTELFQQIQRNGLTSDTADASRAGNKLSGSSRYPSSSRRYYGGGGGGGGRRGGGGGGYGGGGGGRSYTPNIYAPNVNLPRSSMSKIMNTDRVINPDEQYLRPDFETKGSREAYRRSDI